MRRLLVALVALALLVPAVVHAAPNATLERRVSALESEVTALKARVAALEAAPTPTPTPAPTAAPTVAPTPTPTATPAGVPAFGSRPASGALSYVGNCPAVIENRYIANTAAGVAAIRIENCSNVTIRNVDFENVPGGVYALNSTNIRLVGLRYRNITGPHERTGANVGNLVQFNRCHGCSITDSKGIGGDTEDIVSVYDSDDVEVARNHFEGTTWSSSSGSGIMLDAGADRAYVHDNVLLNPGQVGIGIANGVGHRLDANTIYGEQRPLSNIAVYVWNQSGGSCSGHAITNNRVRWYRADGVQNAYWNAGNCGTVTATGNEWSAALDPATLRVVLP